LEDRVVLAAAPSMALPIDVGPISVIGTGTAQQLQAPVNLAGQLAGTLTMDVTTQAAAAAGECPILNLHLEPISLNLLGLHVDTSAICLDVTATDHEGLLGGLLCDLSGGGLTLGGLNGILDQLDGVVGQIDTFLDDLEGLLDNALGRAMTVTNVFGSPVGGGAAAQQADPAFCDILNLSLGPVDLDVPLLGVDVSLDNCANPPGPVTVDVTADPNGGLLGNLLCGLADGIDLRRLNLGGLVNRLDRLIDRLGDLADRLDNIPNLPDRLERVADRLLDQLEKVAGRVDKLADLDRLIKRVEKVTDRLDHLIDHAGGLNRLTGQLEKLVNQLTRIVNRLEDLGRLETATAQLERIIDRLMAQL